MRTFRLGEILETEALLEIYRLGVTRSPAEACGLLIDTPRLLSNGSYSHVIELPNRTLASSGQYVIEPGDIKLSLEGLEDVEEVAVWHTHPSGFEGPSEGDLAQRPNDDVKMVVVALTNHGPKAT